jgi:hypothetical protein
MDKSNAAKSNAGTSGIPTLPAFWDAAGPMGMSYEAYAAWLNDWKRIHDESMQFMRTRLSCDVSAASALAGCTSLTDALHFQMEYASQALSDFVQESQKMTSLFSEMAARTLANPIRSGR